MARVTAKYCSLVCLCLLSGIFCSAQRAEIKEIRALLYEAHDSKAIALALHKKMEDITPQYPLLFGYKGMADIIMCYHTQNPYLKLRYFRLGKVALDKAISEKHDDVELHYLRFTTQVNTPAILMYKDNIAEDKKILVKYVLTAANKMIDKDLYKKVGDYLISSDQCSVEEKSKIQRVRSGSFTSRL